MGEEFEALLVGDEGSRMGAEVSTGDEIQVTSTVCDPEQVENCECPTWSRLTPKEVAPVTKDAPEPTEASISTPAVTQVAPASEAALKKTMGPGKVVLARDAAISHERECNQLKEKVTTLQGSLVSSETRTSNLEEMVAAERNARTSLEAAKNELEAERIVLQDQVERLREE
ncbi:hypothetical protein GUJ93_ZPchr0012g19670 [Zizania palustris]|uniref:Uncharacterized protein n=1 Tax=Zizania palustris TaxID=103762 RepID=A0A8J5WV10_ZIZPA|nr:hypothetical protein GUJ93_ZPchr0012g19670 [Zizania palustris]